ncbi:MAG: pullulanase-type alpha-1,6-glucosidase [Propionibacteriaceae bacterium]|jgi:pullulanase-type alpha-1,6-glucosidase|nr:pullulanase-type alpha-1,6-glucosidase [Propionibacteriaceae bacterium]
MHPSRSHPRRTASWNTVTSTRRSVRRIVLKRVALTAAAVTLIGALAPAAAQAEETATDPVVAAEAAVVTAPGDFNLAIGCGSDWQSDCSATQLTLDPATNIYSALIDVPAGDYQFKIVEGGTWDVNYGADGVAGGNNIDFTATDQPTYFVYNPVTHLSFAAPRDEVVTLPGDYQDALGCGEWDPACLASAMYPQADGTYTFATNVLPEGSYQFKVAVGLGWTENYGEGGGANGQNMSFVTAADENVVFTYDPTTHVTTVDVAELPAVGTGQSIAIWLDRTALAVPPNLGEHTPADLTWSWTGHPEITLTPGETVSTALSDKNKLTAGYTALVPALADGTTGSLEDALVAALKTGPYALTATDAAGETVVNTGMQTALLLDDIFAAAENATIGVTWADGVPSLSLWAPTAQSVTLHLLADAANAEVFVPATLDPATGVWAVAGDAAWKNRSFLWDIEVFVPEAGAVLKNEVTDPYSVALTIDSTASVLVDLDDPAWAPSLWTDTANPEALRTQAEQTIYELDIRDFSAIDETVPAELRGTYAAFTQMESAGMTHLAELSDAGLTTVHLLPSFDIATIPENRADQVTPEVPADVAPASSAARDAITAVADQDAFNWGYDPWHYSTPEGSYASEGNQDGGARVSEFRSMVGGLHSIGLRVVLDQVFNHTSQSGQGEKSILDKVVPEYYHRYNVNGQIETLSCCQDTESQHLMFNKLMVDSLVTWAKDYHVDGFRFDLMGFHSIETMLDVRAALDELTLEKDGVDGAAIYLYGEAWNNGSSVDDALFTAARQANIAGTGIGAFNDRMRDAVRGGGPFDNDQRDYQGFGTGLYTDPNEYPDPAVVATADDGTEIAYDPLKDLYYRTDLVRLGLIGNLATYELPSDKGSGTPILGRDFGYGSAYGMEGVAGRQAAGFAVDPQEVINYIDCHDGTTTFDNGIWKLPSDATMDTRVRMSILGLATAALSQSPTFWHAGDDILRSKSLDHNSYNSGDHFNAIDWSLETNVFGTGLPVTPGDDAAMTPLLENAANKPDQAAMEQSYQMSLDLLRVRSMSPLMTLGSGALINERVTFLNDGVNPTPGFIVMHIDDPAATATTRAATEDLDSAYEALMVVFNASDETITEAIDGQAGSAWQLNDIQANGYDPVVKTTTFNAATGTLTIPARTAAVLVLPQAAVDPVPAPAPEETTEPTVPDDGGSTTAPGGETTPAPLPSVPGDDAGSGSASGSATGQVPDTGSTMTTGFAAAALVCLAAGLGVLGLRRRVTV